MVANDDFERDTLNVNGDFLISYGEDEIAAEEKLCLTLDGATGHFIAAPTNATRRFQNVQAACVSIAERWENIEPPESAVLSNGGLSIYAPFD
ncbi:hypothetical protein ROLI_030900 [Roseobacter fucihabitans]|uniref:DUF1488 domain-containing protein n=2 Tax=Roseobacter fucihabitans TaxID=1537242 RepID=A0ABZ2BVB3_9RHOB|nr:hypothetical protein [Roseobacter litoralis]